MKKTMNFLTALVMIVISFASYAETIDPTFDLKVVGAHSFSVSLERANQDLEVYFLDNKGEILFKDVLYKNEKFEKTFLLSNLPDGDYQLKIKDAVKVQLVSVAYNNQQVDIDFSKIVCTFYPVITESDKLVSVGAVSSSDAPMKVAIEDQYGEIIYSESIKGGDYIGKRFDFSQVKGNYRVVVNRDGLITTKSLAIF